MPEAKQPHLNGAYYGPSIPPPSKTYHRPGRGGSSCNPFSCCCGCLCSCLFNCIFQIILTIAITIGIVVLVLWLILRPNKVKFYATDAALTEFDFSTTNSTLYYNLALNLTIRNPNRRLGIYYDSIEARAMYEGQRFDTVNLDRFYQGTKNTSSLHAEFRGQNIVLLGDSERSHYLEDRSSGMYNVQVKLYLRIRFKFGLIKTHRIKPKIECNLKIPFNPNGTSPSGTYESTSCGYDW